MTNDEINQFKFPIGEWHKPETLSPAERQLFMQQMAEFPLRLRHLVLGLTEVQLHTPYRHGGWTVQEVVHHLADSHMNGLVRMKLALTAQSPPSINPYPEELWAELSDYQLPISVSLNLLDAIHLKWITVLKHLAETEWNKTYLHPQYGFNVSIAQQLSQYAWHGNHHFAHIERLMQRNKW